MNPELLSPAGDRDALDAALKAGADAVYLGGPRFSARAYATNFTDEDLAESIRQCHRLGVKLYITINTLLKDSELFDAYEYAVKVWNMGVDAIIIQDPGLIALLRQFHPAIELHASTQMTVHNKKGADLMAGKGLTRLVLARELTLDEIREISADHETEVFIHGALCISYSGKCLMSSMLGGRSGNRGRCAQNCRMEYELTDAEGKTRAQGYLMSPKDLSTLDVIEDLVRTGTSSLKIEGRMKRPEYVYETVTQYRRALTGQTWNHDGITQLFNREGFNHAFLLGNDGRDMMAFHSPRNSGVVLGRVRQGQIRLQTGLSLGDGLASGDSGFIVTKMKRGEKEVRDAAPGDTVEIYPKQYRDGDLLMKTNDAALMKDIQAKLRQKTAVSFPIRLRAVFRPGEKLLLRADYGSHFIEVTGEVVEASENQSLSRERLTENLAKTGGTPFILETLDLEYEPGFLRISSVNELRRQLLADLEEISLQIRRNLTCVSRADLEDFFAERANARSNGFFSLPPHLVVITSKEQLLACREVQGQGTELTPVLYLWHRQEGSLDFSDARALDEAGIPYWIKLPEILKSEFEAVMASLTRLELISGILTDNYGVMEHLKNLPLTLVGDYKLNLLNSYGRLLFEELQGVTASEELNYSELIGLKDKSDHYVVLYGRTELMHSEYCPIGATVGGRTRTTACSVPCQTMNFSLTDRKGERFPILTDRFCRSYILNCKTKNNLDQQKILKSQGFSHFRCDLTTESYEEAKAVMLALTKGESYFLSAHTRGHYKRGVE